MSRESFSFQPAAPAVAKKRYSSVVPNVSPAFAIAFGLLSVSLFDVVDVGDRNLFAGQ